MLIRGRVRLSWCSLVPSVALVGISLIVLASAAPVTKEKAIADEVAVNGESNKPLARVKRADEIIFDNVQNVAASSVGSSPVKKSDQQPGAKSDDVMKSSGKQQESSPTANSKPEMTQKDAAIDESVGNDDNAVESDSSESSDNSSSDSADSVVWDSDNTDDADKRRRRSALDSEAKNEVVADRTKREASVAMVAENMAVAGAGNSRLQRAKRDLEADEIRDIFESQQPVVGSVGEGRGSDYEGSDYGSPRDYAGTIVSTPDEEEEGEDEGGDFEDGEEDTDEDFDDEILQYVGRPKRRSVLTEDEREEALEEAERQVVRELLAERAAEETRQALINYLTGHDMQMSEPLRVDERYDGRFRDEGFEEGYDGDDEDNNEEENGYDEDDEISRENDLSTDGQEELIEDGDGRFLVEEGSDGSEIDEQSPSVAEQKRFSYPYSYEPYGGRWGALLPGAKRDDHDPYDRLYQLAEALSRPSSVGGSSATDDEYKKK